MFNYVNVEFCLWRYCQYYGNLTNVKTYNYVFPCNFADKNNEVDLYGTGGSVLQRQKEMLEKFTGLRRVELVDLQLDHVDGKSFLKVNKGRIMYKWILRFEIKYFISMFTYTWFGPDSQYHYESDYRLMTHKGAYTKDVTSI